MPSFRSFLSVVTANRDSRLLLQAQLPFLAAVLGVALFLVTENRPFAAKPEVLTGFALVLVATLGAVVVPWRRLPVALLLSIPVVDIVAVAILRDATTGALQGVGILVVFPVLFLAYSFSIRVLAVAVLGSLLVVAYPYLRSGSLPNNPADWGNVVVVPVTVTFIAIAAHIAARQFRQQRRSLKDTLVTSQAVANNVDASVMVLDPDDNVLLINQPARDMIAKAGGGRRSQRDELLVFEADGATSAEIRQDTFGDSMREEDLDRVLLVGEHDEQVALAMTSHNIVRDSGQLVGTVVVGHDVSAFVEAANDREQFLQTMSHELRTPLTSILGYLEVVAEMIDMEQVGIASEMDVIKRNSDRLNALVGALLSVSDSPRPLVPESVDLESIVGDSVLSFDRVARAAGVALRHSPAVPSPAECDALRMRQVVDNLISNAIKYTPSGGTVDVAVSATSGAVSIVVADTGTGIPADEKPRVFERFFRGAAARQQAVQGVGVGLTIVKSIVESHGGSIRLDSTVGSGTRATVRLPASDTVIA